jgi:RNA polymerase sigma-70 factor (ECF subfamily)
MNLELRTSLASRRAGRAVGGARELAFEEEPDERPPATFDEVYERWFGTVCRWVRALGGPSADVDDLAQEVFVVVHRQLPRFDGRNLSGWLYRIAARTVRDTRRGAWFKHLFDRRSRASSEVLDALTAIGAGPGDALERREAERLLYRLLDQMSEKRRRAIILAELQGCSPDEIAHLEGIPPATARTRLHLARRELVARAERLCRRGKAP